MGDQRVVFIGGTPRGQAVLEMLSRRGVVPLAVYVLKEDSHETATWSGAISAMAEMWGVPYELRTRLSAADVQQIREEYRPDLVLVVGWRTILPPEVYEYPRFGCLAVHDSVLPEYRGFAPVNWAVINGERQWGVSLFHVGAGVDDGDVVDQVTFEVGPRTTAAELYEMVTQASVDVIERNLPSICDGTAARTPQDHARATYACARTPGDGQIDWQRQSTAEIDRLIRGLCRPYPGAFTYWKGQKLTLWEAHPVEPAPTYAGRIPGRVVGFTDGHADVLTLDGVMRLTEVQLDGQASVPAGRVIRSIKTSMGLR